MPQILTHPPGVPPSFPHVTPPGSIVRFNFLLIRQAQAGIDGTFNQQLVPPILMAAEKEEAKAVLTLFLKKQGLSNIIAARTINKSDAFVDHLVSHLHSVHRTRYLVGRELTTLEIRESLIPYLESLHDEHQSTLIDVVENFPDPPIKEKYEETVHKQPTPEIPGPPSTQTPNSKRLKALARVTDIAKLPSHVNYLLELGMELEAIKEIIRKFPAFAYYSLDGKIKPVVEFLLDLGIPKQDIPTILTKRPQLCGISLTENLIPTMGFLEELGVDKRQWAKVICRFPPLLTYSRQKLRSTVDFLYEMGLSSENVSKVLTRCPSIISYSVEDKLRPTAEYFQSLDADVAVLLRKSPQTFGLSIEGHLRPVTNFFLENGYSLGDVATMASRYGVLYSFSLTDNLMPKWEFFQTMDYPESELVKFPQYFGYSLVDRIKPRYEMLRQSGVKVLLNQMLSLKVIDFQKLVKRKMQKEVNV
ncbi:mitochondrial transcription termination factorfamily protein [Striga asiatica]|uniref:Mitochondrial transcription termination factorfamily protein n=1 Tax=Striga asiatica TaxID=4170 RepID=A0A5A7R4N7_STRAF|nr:mitochondrial transcription termination factorfamily protein [Striga asiatica]